MSDETKEKVLIFIAVFCVLFTIVVLLAPDNDEVVYDEGYDSGYHEGYNEGYNYGFDEGCEIGEDTGYDEGYSDGIDYGWRDDNIEEVGLYIEEQAVDYACDISEFHPLDEALDIIRCYQMNEDWYNNEPPTKEEFESAVDSVVHFCDYFYSKQYR